MGAILGWMLVALFGLAVLIVVGIVIHIRRSKDRWRPINEAPIDKTLLLLKLSYYGQENPLFMSNCQQHVRLYYGDQLVTIGYKKQNGDHKTWCAVGLTPDANATFIHQDVYPTHFKLLENHFPTSSH